MRLGLNAGSLAALALDELLDVAAELGLDCVELPTGGWSPARHVDLPRLLESDYARRELLARIHDRGLEISALACSGNQLDPATGREHDEAVRGTIALAPLLDVDRVILASGCPGDRHAVPQRQWEEVVIPYWLGLVAHAELHGVARLCVEMRAEQVVDDVPTLARLRDAVGPVVGANYDPSHLMWLGADPLAAIAALGDAICHAHVTPGRGNDEGFWRSLCSTLLCVGYDDVLSIEHKDRGVDPVTAVAEAAGLLRRVSVPQPA
jgi:sugar phosphate isomerase/epimerase